MAEADRKYGSSVHMQVEDLFDVIERHAAAGVAFLALHCGTTMRIVERAKKDGRIDPLVRERDLQMARARVALDLERQIIDPERARSLLGRAEARYTCAACGPNCAAQVAAGYFGWTAPRMRHHHRVVSKGYPWRPGD